MNLNLIYEFNSQGDFSYSYCDSISINFQNRIFEPIINVCQNKFTLQIDIDGYSSIYSLIQDQLNNSSTSENIIRDFSDKLKTKIQHDFEEFNKYYFILQNFELDLNNIYIKDNLVSNSNDKMSNILENLDSIKYVYYPLNGNSTNLDVDYSKIDISKPSSKLPVPELKLNFTFLHKLKKYIVLIIFLIQLLLIIGSYFLYNFQSNFSNTKTPIILIFGIILLCLFSDIWVLFSNNSPAKISLFDKDRKNENIARNKECNFNNKLKANLPLNQKENSTIAILTATFSQGSKQPKMKTYILVDDFIVGKSSSNVDFIIEDESIDDNHARIIKTQNSYFISDLNSKNGTYVNERKIKKDQEILLENNSLIRFGNLEYKFSIT